MTMYLSKKAALVGVSIEGEVTVLGPSRVGRETVLGLYSIIGYPTFSKIRDLEEKNVDAYDSVSEGAEIGSRCMIRSHTVVYERVRLGDGVQTGHGVLIREDTIIDEDTVVGSHSIIDGHVRIGKRVSIQSGSYVPPESVIGNEVFLAPFVVLTNDKYPASKRLLGVIIEDGAVIGANSVLISGVRVGEGAVVASGAVVTKDVPPNKVVIGVPAKVVMTRDEYERKKEAYEGGQRP